MKGIHSHDFLLILEPRRKFLTPYQNQVLMDRFRANTPMKKEERYQIAKSLNIGPRKVLDWLRRQHLNENGKKSFCKCEFTIGVYWIMYCIIPHCIELLYTCAYWNAFFNCSHQECRDVPLIVFKKEEVMEQTSRLPYWISGALYSTKRLKKRFSKLFVIFVNFYIST